MHDMSKKSGEMLYTMHIYLRAAQKKEKIQSKYQAIAIFTFSISRFCLKVAYLLNCMHIQYILPIGNSHLYFLYLTSQIILVGKFYR